MKFTLPSSGELISMCIRVANAGVDFDVQRKEQTEGEYVVETEVEADVVDVVVDLIATKLARTNAATGGVHFGETRQVEEEGRQGENAQRPDGTRSSGQRQRHQRVAHGQVPLNGDQTGRPDGASLGDQCQWVDRLHVVQQRVQTAGRRLRRVLLTLTFWPSRLFIKSTLVTLIISTAVDALIDVHTKVVLAGE